MPDLNLNLNLNLPRVPASLASPTIPLSGFLKARTTHPATGPPPAQHPQEPTAPTPRAHSPPTAVSNLPSSPRVLASPAARGVSLPSDLEAKTLPEAGSPPVQNPEERPTQISPTRSPSRTPDLLPRDLPHIPASPAAKSASLPSDLNIKTTPPGAGPPVEKLSAQGSQTQAPSIIPDLPPNLPPTPFPAQVISPSSVPETKATLPHMQNPEELPIQTPQVQPPSITTPSLPPNYPPTPYAAQVIPLSSVPEAKATPLPVQSPEELPVRASQAQPPSAATSGFLPNFPRIPTSLSAPGVPLPGFLKYKTTQPGAGPLPLQNLGEHPTPPSPPAAVPGIPLNHPHTPAPPAATDAPLPGPLKAKPTQPGDAPLVQSPERADSAAQKSPLFGGAQGTNFDGESARSPLQSTTFYFADAGLAGFQSQYTAHSTPIFGTQEQSVVYVLALHEGEYITGISGARASRYIGLSC